MATAAACCSSRHNQLVTVWYKLWYMLHGAAIAATLLDIVWRHAKTATPAHMVCLLGSVAQQVRVTAHEPDAAPSTPDDSLPRRLLETTFTVTALTPVPLAEDTTVSCRCCHKMQLVPTAM